MPELPEVETIVRGLTGSLVGQRVGDVIVHRADVVRPDAKGLRTLLVGRYVTRVWRRGKHIGVAFEGDVGLAFHLGMSGQLTVQPGGARLETHTHLRLTLAGSGRELRFRDPRRFGGVWVRRDAATPEFASCVRLGDEPLDISRRDFAGLLRRRRQIKALLLDQRVLAGLGNIYVDEILYRAGIHPLTSASELSDTAVGRLWRTMRRVLREAIAAGGSTIQDHVDANGRPGEFQHRHRVYGREGQPCPRCGALIVKCVVAGRGTHICPRCQLR